MTPVTPRHFCVAGVALGDIHLDFTWQAWHNRTSTVVLRGRLGTDGTGWRAWSTSSLTRSIFHTHLCHTHTTTYIHTYSHTYVPSYIHTYVRTYIHTCIHTYIHTYRFTFSIFHHLLCLSFLPSPR